MATTSRGSKLRQRYWIGAIATATVIAIAYVAQAYVNAIQSNGAMDWTDQFLRNFSNWYLWVLAFPLIFFLAKKFRFDSGEKLKSFLLHLLAGTIIACVHATLQVFISDLLFHPERNWNAIQKIFEDYFIPAVLWRFIIYLAILAVCMALDFYQRTLETEIQSSRMEDGILQAQIESLRMQIDPDFLFKSLKQLSNLIHEDLDSADNMVARLGDYLRITLENSVHSEISLREEVEFLKCYLEIENIQRIKRVEIQMDFDSESLDCDVPNMILQAPIEDAIRRHPDEDPIYLKISCERTDSSLILFIIDSYISVQNGESQRLKRLLDRLNALNKNPIAMHCFSNSKGFETKIEIPLDLERRNQEETIIEQQADPIESIDSEYKDTTNPVRKWLATIGVFTFLIIYFSIYRVMRGQPMKLLELSGWYIWALITPFVLNLSARFPLQKRNLTKHIAIHFCGFVVAWIVATILYTGVFWAADLGEIPFAQVLSTNFVRSPFSLDIVCYLTIVAVESALRNYKRLKWGTTRSVKLSAQLARARLQALKMQLHPHFLFNALNSLSELIQEDPAAAQDMIENLQKFLRLTLNSRHVHEIPFEKELEFLECYLAIEHVRFQNRLSIKMDIEPQAMNVAVPNLLLQPIVENAIRHGIAPRRSPGQIEIRAKRNNEMLQVSVQDNGPGLNKSQNKVITRGSGLGLSNTQERLTQLYGNDHRFEMVNAPEGGLIVTLEIPAHSGKSPEETGK